MGSRARPYMPRARPLLLHPRLRQYAARTTLCDARVTPFAARTAPLLPRLPATFQDSSAGDFAPRNPTYPT